MTRRWRFAFGGAAIAGLTLYLWAALAAPVVLWSDSQIDMDWARTGIGVFRPVPEPPPGEPLVHPPKAGYLVFLTVAMRAAPRLGEARSIVLVQSLLLWLSIVATSWLIARRTGPAAGLGTLLLLFSVLRIRDGASAVMSEAIAAALFLPLAALAVWTMRRPALFAATGLGSAVLFTIRPDIGAVLFLMASAVLLLEKHWRPLAIYAATFLLLIACSWLATRSAAGSDPLRGLGHPILEASADYYWRPSLGQWPRARTQTEMGRRELEQATANWKRTLSRPGSDTRRQLAWRAFRGLLGTEFYDARWSRTYQSFDTFSRIATPLLILIALAALLLPIPGASQPALAGSALLLSVIGHNLVLGSNPRYLLPVLPFLLVPAAVALPQIRHAPLTRSACAALLLALFVVFASFHREVFDWQWGMIESAGVKIRQPIARGTFPARAPATLHVRIAPTLLPSNAHLTISGPGSRLLYSSVGDSGRERPYVTIALPEWLLEENRRGAVELELASQGGYGQYQFLLFPVIPPPWSKPASREGSRELSPASGVGSGALDWWAHAGPAD